VAFTATAILVIFARGPHESGWVGWSGGWQLVRREKMTDLSPTALTENVGKGSNEKHKMTEGPGKV
jgi:hypothetical protein